MTTGNTITTDTIRTLKAEAEAAGDAALAATCADALDKSLPTARMMAARQVCAEAIDEARARASTYTQHEAARLARNVDKGGFSMAAIAWAEETGSDVEVDVARMLLGLTVEDFRAECEDQADEDRLPGIADYVSAVAACAERARSL